MTTTGKAKSPTATQQPEQEWTADERAAMKERAQELKRAKRRGRATPVDEEAEVLAKIAELTEADRDLAERFHALVRASAPELSSKLWYGMPAYARNGKTICFFQAAAKFKARYATVGFSADANLDEGVMWPTSYALTEWNADVAERMGELVRRAAG